MGGISNKPSASRKAQNWTIVLFAIAFLFLYGSGISLRWRFLQVMPSALVASDTYGYLPASISLITSRIPSRSPIYGFFLAVIDKALGSIYPVIVLQHGLTILAALLAAGAFAYFFRMKRVLAAMAAFIISYLILMDRNLLIYEHWLLTDYLYSISLVFAAVFIGVYIRKPNRISALLMAMIVLETALIRGVGLYAIPIGAAVIFMVTFRRRKKLMVHSLIYLVVIGLGVLSLSFYNYKKFAYFGISSIGTLQLFALVADAGALDLDGPRDAEYKKLIRPAVIHFLQKYPPAVNAEKAVSLGWPLYPVTLEPDFNPPLKIIAAAVNYDESKYAGIMKRMAVEGLLKYPQRYFKFSWPSMRRYLTYFGGGNRILDDPFFRSRRTVKEYLRTHQKILPSMSRKYPFIIPSFYAYRHFSEENNKQPVPQRFSLIVTWVLLPLLLFELARPRVLGINGRVFLAALILMGIGQALMGFLCLGTFRYILPMTIVSYMISTFGVAVFVMRIADIFRKKRTP